MEGDERRVENERQPKITYVKNLGFVRYASSNICFQFFNNITRIFTHFFIHIFKKIKNCYLNTHTKRVLNTF